MKIQTYIFPSIQIRINISLLLIQKYQFTIKVGRRFSIHAAKAVRALDGHHNLLLELCVRPVRRQVDPVEASVSSGKAVGASRLLDAELSGTV